jgi:hypothetical protein
MKPEVSELENAIATIDSGGWNFGDPPKPEMSEADKNSLFDSFNFACQSLCDQAFEAGAKEGAKIILRQITDEFSIYIHPETLLVTSALMDCGPVVTCSLSDMIEDNSAYGTQGSKELASILREIANRLDGIAPG